MNLLATSVSATGSARYHLRVAVDRSEIRAAQRLRYRVFAEELGARLHATTPGLDVDEFDEHCDHLIVFEESTGEAVGTYRMLPPGRTDRRYADAEFDRSALRELDADTVEAGRSCVHPAHRSGAVINLMWAGIARYLHLSGHNWLAGCASVGLADGGQTAAAVWNLMASRHLSPPAYRVVPRLPWIPVTRWPSARVAVPSLLRGYLRLGAWICGAPAHDPDFGCADLYVLLALDRIDPRYLRHFLGDASLGNASLGSAGLSSASLSSASLGDAGPGDGSVGDAGPGDVGVRDAGPGVDGAGRAG